MNVNNDLLKRYALANEIGDICQDDEKDPIGVFYAQGIQESLDSAQPEGWIMSVVYGRCYAYQIIPLPERDDDE